MLTLRKKDKIISPIEIKELRTTGKKGHVFPFKLYYRENKEQEGNRIVISVPKKIFKRAVVRTLIRRRSKEAYRLNKAALATEVPVDLLLVYTFNEVLPYEKINASIREILSTIVEDC